MLQRITLNEFVDAFRRAGRENQFSWKAKKALFEYLEQLEEDTGVPIELDVVALCCDYQEADVSEIISDYGLDASSCKDDDDRRELVEKFLGERTNVIWHDGDVFLFQQF
jgi:hypothetical protein